MQALSTLPNREGFKFRGIRKDGGKFMNCRLKHLPGGMYIVAAGEYVYKDVAPELAGWEPHPKRSKTLQERILDAEVRCAQWLADGNAHREAGRNFKADQCYEKSQFWLDRYNRLKDEAQAWVSVPATG